MSFQRVEMAVLMLLGSVPIKVTVNSENVSGLGLYGWIGK